MPSNDDKPPAKRKRERDAPTATHHDARGAAPRPVAAFLRVEAPGESGATYRLTGGKCVVGSGPQADFVVADSTVSRLHAELELVPDGVLVRDLNSHNGTYYLDQKIEAAVLSLGASIQLGRAVVSLGNDPSLWDDGDEYDGDSYRGVIGRSPVMRKLFRTLVRLEGSTATVLLEGESGAGKELVAAAIHRGSALASHELVTVNCGALPRDLVASELFGHRRGAFTGATDHRKGAFETADGGTLFLDEVGELPLEVQPMLLRALETGEVRAVGSDRAKKVRVRFIAATNRDLKVDVETGRFREDLFYRLAVVRLRAPSLRERPEDIAPLAAHFAREAGLHDLPTAVVEQLKARAWPGNVRELRNAVQAYAALGSLPAADGPQAGALELALSQLVDVERPYVEQKDELIDRFTRLYLTALLAHTGGNQSAAARLAGLDRGYLGRLLTKHGARPKS